MEEGLESWSYLKKRIEELGLKKSVNRTKANCLRLCTKGPIALVYPEGAWYHSCTPEVIEKILQQHILNDQIVSENLLELAPLKKADKKGDLKQAATLGK